MTLEVDCRVDTVLVRADDLPLGDLASAVEDANVSAVVLRILTQAAGPADVAAFANYV